MTFEQRAGVLGIDALGVLHAPRYRGWRTPADSGLFQNSAILVDLDALLGADAERFKQAASAGTPLTRIGPVLETIANDRTTFVTILPADHALQAGMKQNGRWRLWTTPAAKVPQPPVVQALLKG